MRYIDKYIHHKSAMAINLQYIADCYSSDIDNPIPSLKDTRQSFEDFKKPNYRKGGNGWERLLLLEQTFDDVPRCCYCMRKLNPSSSKINYEHVIPCSLSGTKGVEEYKYYCSHSNTLHDHIVMADVFASQKFTSISDIYAQTHIPHSIGLSNILVACNGKRDTLVSDGCCCNNSRGNARLRPILLSPKCNNTVNYDENGILSISESDETLEDLINELNDETFKEIRSIWYNLSTIDIDTKMISKLSHLERVSLFKRSYDVDDFELLPDYVIKYAGNPPTIGNDNYWHLLLAYDWFYFYYSEKYRNRA